MKFPISLILVLAWLDFSTCYPAIGERDPEQGDKFEGDIVLSPGQRKEIELGDVGRNGLREETYRWPERNVYYKFHEPHFDGAHINHIRRGMQILEEVSCIRFHPANETSDRFVNITGFPGGCYSSVGYLGKTQGVNFAVYDLDTGCFRLATIVHEFLHTLGFYHQQSAPDRDNYVQIVEENIQAGTEHNFNKYNSSFVTDFGIEYDYGSVMHYGSTAFSKNGKKTIVPLDPKAEIGQRKGLSPKDIFKLNIMYKCPIPVM